VSKFTLAPEHRNVSSSVRSAKVSTVTDTVGETSDEGQNLEPPNRRIRGSNGLPTSYADIKISSENACYMESIGTPLVKTARRIGSIRNCLLLECALFRVNEDLSVT
jgi:hypothetical protein